VGAALHGLQLQGFSRLAVGAGLHGHQLRVFSLLASRFYISKAFDYALDEGSGLVHARRSSLQP
jgi:hypothetical protein